MIDKSRYRVLRMFLGANMFSNTDAHFKQNTLLPESAHSYFRMGDAELTATLGGYGINADAYGTDMMFDWLKKDCK